jgi:integrase
MSRTIRAPASVNRKLEALRRFCRWAHTTGKLRTNVAAELKLARAPRGTRPKALLPVEVQGLLRAAGQSRRALARRNYAVVQLLLQAGLRVSEAAALRIEDLEIRERQGEVRIRARDGVCCFRPPAGSPRAGTNRSRLDNLSLVPNDPHADKESNHHDPRARHRHELAEPPQKPKKLSHREQRTALRAALRLPPQ